MTEVPVDDAGEILADEERYSKDGLIGHRVHLVQPRQGYRAGSDAVFLAAAVQSITKNDLDEHILDAGCGAGAVSLCLAHRLGAARIDGLELQAEYCTLYDRNAGANDFADRMRGFCGDIAQPPDTIRKRQYDQVVSNPPFFQKQRSQASPDATKDRAHREAELSLGEWLAACLRRLRPGGVLTLIQAGERLPDLLAALAGAAGDIVIFPIWSRPGGPASRVIVRAVKARRGPARLQSGLLVNDGEDGRSAASNDILRHGAPLDILHR